MDSKEIISKKKLSNSYKFIKALQKAGKLYVDGTKVSNSGFPQLETLFRAVETFYQGVWDIDFNLRTERLLKEKDTEEEILNLVSYFEIKGVYLFFKYVTISNSQGKSHSIEDLYVKIVLTYHSEELKIIDLQGTRGILTTLEYRNGYGHSHLSGVPGQLREKRMGSFCLGSGEINRYMSRVNSSRDSFKDNIQSLLLQIMTLVSWESLEGVPYHRMSNMISSTSEVTEEDFKRRLSQHHTKKQLIDRILPLLLKRIQDSQTKPKIVYNNKGISIVRDEAYYNLFDDIQEEELRVLGNGYPSFLLTKRLNNKIFKFNSSISDNLSELSPSEKDFNDRMRGANFLLFQGEYIKPKVIILPSMDKGSEEIPYKVDKFFIDFLTSTIEKRLDRIFTESYFKNKFNQQVK